MKDNIGSTVLRYSAGRAATRRRYTVLSWGCIALIGALMCIFAYKKFNRYARKAGNVKESILSDGKAGNNYSKQINEP